MLPENDRWSETRAQLLAQMDVSMGGRVAEELIFGDDYITTGEGLRQLDEHITLVTEIKIHMLYIMILLLFQTYLLCFSGASSDFDGATKIAKMMVTRFGMSDKVNFIIV